MPKPTLLLVDDHILVRQGIKSLLEGTGRFQVAGEAKDGLEALDIYTKTRPDLVLMDLNMPILDGIDATERIKALDGSARVLILTIHGERERIRAAMEVGADGYLLKDTSAEEFAQAIEAVLRGKVYLSPEISGVVVQDMLGNSGPGTASGWDKLSKREKEVYRLIEQGYRNKDISHQLFISIKTVEKHRANMMRKLSLKGLQELYAYMEQRRQT